MSDSRFHFSPRPNRAAEIGWQPWGAEAFERAQREDKPVLLGISAVWCHWCHVMDETSYSDKQVIGLINDRFVPVRVDNDQRPDINARYNMGGWPTTAFLTPKGEVLAGMTYIAPEQMRDVLNQVSQYYKDNKTSIEAKLAEIESGRRRSAEAGSGDETDALSDQILRDVLHAAEDQYDPVHGGFGNEPKFPHTDAIDLLLRVHLRDGDRDALHMARKTLERMTGGGTYDQEWGGFYRYSTKRDWSIPHYEKMLEDNAQLLQALCKLYRIDGAAWQRRYIEFTIAYLDRWLSDEATGAFYGSQDADEEFYPLPSAEREKHDAPYVDRTIYTSWNAMAISAYLEASWTLGAAGLRDRALRALDYVWGKLRGEGGGMSRYLAEDGPRIAESQGHFAASYASAVDALLHPGALVKIVAAPAEAGPLRDAALALPVADRTVRAIDPGDSAALAAEALPAQPAPAAYACYGTLCSAPATTPADLVDAVERTRRAYESTQRGEPLAAPRSERSGD